MKTQNPNAPLDFINAFGIRDEQTKPNASK